MVRRTTARLQRQIATGRQYSRSGKRNVFQHYTIGTPELIAVWEYPNFDASQRAFCYARVIEISTPRWTAYDTKRFGVKMNSEVPMITQERAYTSPIWHTP